MKCRFQILKYKYQAVVEQKDNMDFGGEERNNLERSSREVATASIQHTEECRMKQVNSEPGEPDCDPCLTDHVISV